MAHKNRISTHMPKKTRIITSFTFHFLQFHKTSPKCITLFPAVMPKQGFFSDGSPNFIRWDVILAPLENQYTVWFKHPHTLSVSVV